MAAWFSEFLAEGVGPVDPSDLRPALYRSRLMPGRADVVPGAFRRLVYRVCYRSAVARDQMSEENRLASDLFQI
jgi:hypothetical protein